MKNISKIAVSFLFALLVLVAGSAFTSKAQAVVNPTLTIGSVVTTSGSSISVPINAINFRNKVAGMDLLVNYDPTLLRIDSITENPSLNDPLFNKDYSSNLIYLSYLAPVNQNFNFDNGVIATLNFTVLVNSNITSNLNFKTTAPGLRSNLYDRYGSIKPASFMGGVVNISENTLLTVSTYASSPSAGSIEVSNTDSTLDVLMNKFKIKDQGLDAEIKKINLSLTGVGATPAEIASAIKIKVGEDIVAVNDVSLNTNGIYEFTLANNFIIPSGVTTIFSVYADINHLDSNFSQGDSFKIDYASVIAEDISGNNITNVVGSADGEVQTFYLEGIVVNLVSTSAVKTAGEPGVSSDSGLFDITFDVTAFGGDMWIDKTAPTVAGGITESDLDITGTGNVTATITSSNAFAGTEGFLAEEGATRRFTITTNIIPTVTGFFNVKLMDLLYASSDINGNLHYLPNANSFETSSIYLNTWSMPIQGIIVNPISTTATVTAGEPGVSSDSGLFDITFDVTAFGGDMWIDKTAPTVAGGITESDLDITGTGNAIAVITSTNAFAGTEGFLVEEGATRRFTITTYISPTITGFFKVKLMDLLHASSDINGNFHYLPNANSFETSSIYLNTWSMPIQGIIVNPISTTATVTAGEPGVVSDSGTFTITFDVTAFGGDMWIDKTAPTVAGGITESDLDITGTGNAIATITSSTTSAGVEGFPVLDDNTERFTITTYISPTVSGFFNVKLMDLLYASSDINGNLHHASDNNSFMTPSIYLSTMAPSIISVPKVKSSSGVKQIINKDIVSISTEDITEELVLDTVVSTANTDADSEISLDVVVVENKVDEIVKEEEVSISEAKEDSASEIVQEESL